MNRTERIFPRWAASWGSLARSNALVRSQCRLCGIQQRVDATIQARRFGGAASPLDQLDACSLVGCHGRIYFMVARSYGRPWLTMLSSEVPSGPLDQAAPAANAATLDLIRAAPR